MRPPTRSNPDQVFWHSAALFINDNVATQIDGLAHITAGRRQPLVQRLQGGRLGRRLGPPQVRRHDHPADHHPRRPDRRGRLQEGRRPARPHRITAEDLKATLAWRGRDAAARRRRAGPHRHRPLLGRGRRRPREDRRARLRRHRPRRRRSGWSRSRGRSWSAPTPAASRSARRPATPGTAHPRPPLPAGRAGRPHRRVPQPRRAGKAKAYEFCYVAAIEQDPGDRRRLRAAADRHAVSRGAHGPDPPRQHRPSDPANAPPNITIY